MPAKAPDGIVVESLADRPELMEPVGLMRWQEWGRFPEPESLEWWTAATRHEAGQVGMPITLVATNGAEVHGCAGLAERDIEERVRHSPWLIGMIVRPASRRMGIGRCLVAAIESEASRLGFEHLWVATERARDFYESCGFVYADRVERTERPAVNVLRKALA